MCMTLILHDDVHDDDDYLSIRAQLSMTLSAK